MSEVAAGAAPRLGPRDLLRGVTVDDPQVDPTGTLVAWRRGHVVRERDAYETALVVQDLEGGEARVVVAARPGLRLARWSPDGRWLVFVARGGGGSELFAVPAAGGEPRALTALGGPIDDVVWSPRGDVLALVLPRHEGPPPGTGAAADVMRVTRLRWKRDGVGLVGDRFDSLAVVPFDPAGPAVREPRWLVCGRVDVAGPRWSPDGRSLAFVSALDDPEWEASRRQSVYVLDMTVEGAPPRRLASFADVRAQALAWSPDGRRLAVTGHDHEGIGHYGAQRLWTIDVASGARRALTGDQQGTFGNASYTDTGGGGDTGPVWLPDGSGLVAVLSERARVRLVRVALGGTIRHLSPDDRVIAGFAMAPRGDRIVVVSQPRDRSADLERIDVATDGSPRPPVRLTDVGAEVLAGAEVLGGAEVLAGAEAFGGAAPAAPRHVRVDDGRGPVLDAWVLLPSRPRGERVPVILSCGGGPGGMRSDNLQFEWQVFAAAGYAVAWVNTRGCQAYGDPFCTAILGSWGEADFADNLRGLDAVLAAHPELDAERLAIAGGSYGGYQVVWALGHTTRFRAAVADRSVNDKLAAFGMSDIGPQRAFEFGGARPWEDEGAYLRQSPLAAIGSAVTPTLVIHSAEDHRCTVGQGEALFASLQVLGVETRLVRFANESHGLSRGGRPWHRVRRLQEYLDWFERHLAPGAVPTRGTR